MLTFGFWCGIIKIDRNQRDVNKLNEELVVKPKIDVVFKTLFVEHTDLLIDFLSYALRMPTEEIADIVITNPELIPDTYGEKFAQLDLVLTQPNGTKINVEIQNGDKGDYKERSVFNCSKMYTKDVNVGDIYKDIPKTVCINIVQFDLFKDSECVCTVFPTIQETGEIVTDKWEIIYFQTPKIPTDESGGLWDWIKLFTITTEGELETMENVKTMGVKRAAGFIRQMNADDRMKEIARLREKARMAEASAYRKAQKAGFEEGEQSTLLKTATNLLSLNVPIDVIVKATGLSEKEIEAL
jgi:predicted transposase/invertase (TIGR01784 family)